jgi:hypothetical protein
VANPGNLKPPWQPGQSGNPRGYSRRRRLADALVALIEDSKAESAVARVVLKGALEGDLGFLKLLFEQVDGKLPVPVAITSDEGITEDAIAEAAAVAETRKAKKRGKA